jgi:nucleotide-binding universal stress UspA family protein
MSAPLVFLVPVDGSGHALAATRHVADLARRGLPVVLHLLNVQAPVRGTAAMLIAKSELDSYHRDEGMKALAPARQEAEALGTTPHVHVTVGQPGDMILAFAERLGAQQICMGTRGYGGVTGAVLGSVANHVVARSPVPVTLLHAD